MYGIFIPAVKLGSKLGRPPGPSAAFPDRVDLVLKAAGEVFARRGFDAASVREIARSAGLTPAALYHYFPSKEALMEGLIDRMMAGPAEGIRAVEAGSVLSPQSLHEALMALAGGFFRGAADPEAKRMLHVVFMAAHERPEWGERYLRGLTDPSEVGAAAILEALLPEGARGRVSPTWLIKQTFGALLSFVIHEEVLRRGGGNHPDREAYLRQVVEVTVAGVEAIAGTTR